MPATASVDPLTNAQNMLNNLNTILANELAYEAANGPRPTYTVGGRSFDWAGWLAMMTDQIEKWMKIVAMLDTGEVHVRGYPGSS